MLVEDELQVEQQPEIKEVIERQPDDAMMSDVEPIRGEGTLEKSYEAAKGRPPDRLGLMYSNKKW